MTLRQTAQEITGIPAPHALPPSVFVTTASMAGLIEPVAKLRANWGIIRGRCARD